VGHLCGICILGAGALAKGGDQNAPGEHGGGVGGWKVARTEGDAVESKKAAEVGFCMEVPWRNAGCQRSLGRGRDALRLSECEMGLQAGFT